MAFAYPIYKSEDEAQKARLLPQNNYEFEVIRVEHCMSKTQNDQLKILLKLIHSTGSSIITDYIPLTEKWGFKLRHFAEAIGLLSEYESGTFDENKCSQRKGKYAKIIYRDGNNGYLPSNAIADYVTEPGTESVKQKSSEEPNDDIPW